MRSMSRNSIESFHNQKEECRDSFDQNNFEKYYSSSQKSNGNGGKQCVIY